MKNAILLIGVSILSGIASAIFVFSFPLGFLFIPPAIYGFLSGLCFIYMLSPQRSWDKLVGWILTAILAYDVAYFVGGKLAELITPGAESISNPLFYVSAGFLGAVVLAAAFSSVFSVRLSRIHFLLIAAAGAVIPFLICLWLSTPTAMAYVGFSTYNSPAYAAAAQATTFFKALFVLWQVVVTVLLGFGVSTNSSRALTPKKSSSR